MVDALGNAAASILGNPKKAFLVIHKERPEQSNPKTIVENTERMLTILNAGGGGALAAAGGVANAHVMQVQYNPSTISFRASADAEVVPALRQQGGNSVQNQITQPASIIMSVELIFDAVNVKDSFMYDKLEGTSVGGVVSSIAAITNAVRKKPYTVQPQTNGLLAMVLFKEFQRVTFHWADTTFTGQVSEAQAKYKMFSVSGRPVRSAVQIQIRQCLDNKEEAARWDEKFNKCFGKETAEGDYGRKNIGQYTSNLINLGF